MKHPDIEPPYLHATAGSLLYWVDEDSVVREKHFNHEPIACIDISVRRAGVQVMNARVCEAFVRDDGDAWLRVYLEGAEYDVPVLQSMRRITEEEERGETWPVEWVRTDQISLWYREQRLLARSSGTDSTDTYTE
jgi:hypothetical protein